MGIPGLLKLLRSITSKTHLKDLAGKRVAIDGHCWIHRGAISCCKALALGSQAFQFISFFLNMIELLRMYGIVDIVVVFDGGTLPMKCDAIEKRCIERQKNLLLAVAAESINDITSSQRFYQQSVSVTPEMVHDLTKALTERGIVCIVSPYESDAQLAFLSQLEYVDIVITEDSDSIVYGCKKVLFKLGRDGIGDLLVRNQLCYNRDLSFANWSDDQFKLFCCLCGCDYLPNAKSIGPKTAYKIVSKFKTLSRVADFLRTSPKYQDLPVQFFPQLLRAVMTFKHQTIFNVETGCMEPLTPLPQYSTTLVGSVVRRTDGATEDMSFLGPLYDPHIATAIAQGVLNPVTLKPFGERSSNEGAAVLFRRVQELVMQMTFTEKVQLLQNPDANIGKYLPLLTSNAGPVEISVRAGNQVDWSFHRNCMRVVPRERRDKNENQRDVNQPTTVAASNAAVHFKATEKATVDSVNGKRNIDWVRPAAVQVPLWQKCPSSLRYGDTTEQCNAAPVSDSQDQVFQSSKVSPVFMTMKRRSVNIVRGVTSVVPNRTAGNEGSSHVPKAASRMAHTESTAGGVTAVAPVAVVPTMKVRSPHWGTPEGMVPMKRVRHDEQPFFSGVADIAVPQSVCYGPFFDQDRVNTRAGNSRTEFFEDMVVGKKPRYQSKSFFDNQ